MKNYFSLFLLLFIFTYFNTGCNSGNDKAENQTRAVRYKSGTVMIKENSDYAEQTDNFYIPESSVGEVEVGPESVKFGPEN